MLYWATSSGQNKQKEKSESFKGGSWNSPWNHFVPSDSFLNSGNGVSISRFVCLSVGPWKKISIQEMINTSNIKVTSIVV